FGPSTTAPFSTGGDPFNEPARFATWWWMQCGNVLPSPTISEVPHALAPRTFASHLPLYAAYVLVPDNWSYSLAMTESPPPWDVVSHAAHAAPVSGNAKPNGSVAA